LSTGSSPFRIASGGLKVSGPVSVDPRKALELLFGASKYVIGMVHLLPLPGCPRWAGEMEEVLERAVADALALESGGVDGLMVENFRDVPFGKRQAEAHTVAAMTLAVAAVRDAVDLPVGVNVLRNDARSALAIASVTGVSFIRVNVHTGVMVTDQGLIEGSAYETIRYRRELGVDVKVFADVLVKHANPLGSPTIEQAARDTAYRGLADALIVTGPGTGEPTEAADVKRTREAVPDFPVLVGSGASQESVGQLLSVADGIIVGTGLKEHGIVSNPVDRARVAALMAEVQKLR
jgi:membrane complex biogenesis BtpA family protein